MTKKINEKYLTIDRRMLSTPKHQAIINGTVVRVTKAQRKFIRTNTAYSKSNRILLETISNGHEKVMNFINRGINIQKNLHELHLAR